MSLKRCQSSFLHQDLTPACSTLFFTKAGMLCPSNFQRSRLLSTSWHIAVLLPELMASHSIVGLEWRLIKTEIFWDVVKTWKQLRLCKSCDWECWRIQHNPAIKSDIFGHIIYDISYQILRFSCSPQFSILHLQVSFRHGPSHWAWCYVATSLKATPGRCPWKCGRDIGSQSGKERKPSKCRWDFEIYLAIVVIFL